MTIPADDAFQSPSACDPKRVGQILRHQAHVYTVRLDWDGSEWACLLKGVLKKRGEAVLTGDRVVLDWLDPVTQTGRIAAVLPRTSQLTRPKVANVQQVLVVMPYEQPTFDPRQLDRTLAHVALTQLPCGIALTKVDLAEATQAADTPDDPPAAETSASPDPFALTSPEQIAAFYNQLGYPVFLLSSVWPHHYSDWDRLLAWLTGQTTVLAGMSGAGKSTLLNQLKPGLALKTGEVSSRLERGQHTTRHVALLPVAPGAWVADTPGFSHWQADTLSPKAVREAFCEFTPFQADCPFTDCYHEEEADCAVRPLVGQTLHAGRYAHYRELLAEARQAEQQRMQQSQKQEATAKTKQRAGGEPDTEIVKLSRRHRQKSRRLERQQVEAYWCASATDEDEPADSDEDS